MNKATFQESLLQIMEQKDHWAWSSFTTGQVAKENLHVHLEQEYEVYVRERTPHILVPSAHEDSLWLLALS